MSITIIRNKDGCNKSNTDPTILLDTLLISCVFYHRLINVLTNHGDIPPYSRSYKFLSKFLYTKNSNGVFTLDQPYPSHFIAF